MAGYRDTLNLPKTDFPMKADLPRREPERLRWWAEKKLYERLRAARAGAPVWLLHDGPPYSNGHLHMGTASNKVWKDHYPVLDKEMTAYLKKLEQSGLEKSCPAAFTELRGTMRNVKGNAEAVEFGEDGACKGSIDYRTKKPTKTIHSEDFAFETVLRDVEATRRAAAGEFLLWVIKDYRRAGPRTALSDALRSEHRRAGISTFVEALDSFKDVEGTERLIRGLPGGK